MDNDSIINRHQSLIDEIRDDISELNSKINVLEVKLDFLDREKKLFEAPIKINGVCDIIRNYPKITIIIIVFTLVFADLLYKIDPNQKITSQISSFFMKRD